MAQFDNPASNQGAQGNFQGPVIINNHNRPSSASSSNLTSRQRNELLGVLVVRYQRLLKDSLALHVRLLLGLHTRPDAVDPAWRRLHMRAPRVSRIVPPGTSALELFDQQEGQLLVLGEPGAGKTMLITELALALTQRALADQHARIPVLLNLAAWDSGQTLREWLPRELRRVFGGSDKAAEQLAGGDDLLLLLDGLDEVAQIRRTACVEAINAYLLEGSQAAPLVVGCRNHEYVSLDAKLQIAGAVELEPLELPAIEGALADVPDAQGVLAALQTDGLLRELATTPLIVNVLLLAHGGQDVPAVQAQTLDERRSALWHTYVRRMFQQRPQAGWPVRQALGYLRWLARQLCQQNETNFLIDDLQPSMVPLGKPPRHCIWIGCLAGALFGTLLGALVGWIAVASESAHLWFETKSSTPLSAAVALGLLGMMCGGFLGGVAGSIYDSLSRLIRKPVERLERLRWSWTRMRSIFQRAREDHSFLVSVLLICVINAVVSFVLIMLVLDVVFGVIAFIFTVIVSGMYVAGYRREDVYYSNPMQSVKYSFWTTFISILPITLFYGVSVGLFNVLVFRTGGVVGLLSGLIVCFLVTLYLSFHAHIQHHALRHILSRAGLFPLRAVTFLDAMSARLLLERDGAVYRFRHILLRDYLASLTDAQLDDLAHDL